MFLSRIRINSARRGARKLLASPQAMHAAVRAGFADDADHAGLTGRALWRIDTASTHDIMLYVASPGRPDFTHIVEQAGWPVTQSWQTREYAPFLASLDVGQRWAFRLTANPTHEGRRADGEPTQRFGHLTAAQQVGWLESRAKKWGFSVSENSGTPSFVVTKRDVQAFRRRSDQPSDRRVQLTVAQYDGILDVTDPDLIRAALSHGFGHAKAYGCGLMTLAPVTPL